MHTNKRALPQVTLVLTESLSACNRGKSFICISMLPEEEHWVWNGFLLYSQAMFFTLDFTEFGDICVLTARGNSVRLINLPMFFIVPPFSFIDRTTSIVKGSLSVLLTLHEIPCVLIALGILGSIRSPQNPDVCASSMLPGKRAHVIEIYKSGFKDGWKAIEGLLHGLFWKKWWMFFSINSWICWCQ